MDDNKKRRLAEIAYMYYIDGMSQSEIAREYSISRSMVSTMLSEARAKGIVKIQIEDSDLYCLELQKKMEHVFGIKKIIIVPRLSKNETNLLYQLADSCIDYLNQIIEDNMTIAVSWGRTLYQIANRIRSKGKSNLTISPLVGGIGNEMNMYHSNVICDIMANNLGGNSLGLYAPVFVSSKEVKDVIFKDKSINKVIETSRKAHIAIVSIGNILSSVMREIGTLSEEDVSKLLELEAIGDINTIFIDKNGKVVESHLSERTIALTIEELKRIPKIIAVAGGVEKTEAIHAALKGKLMDVLVTDEEVAKEILKNYE